MTSLPAALRDALGERLPLLSARELTRTHAKDGTQKLLLQFPPGPHPNSRAVTVETVHIPPHDPRSSKGATLCVSSQAGCPVACPFCASGLAGLARNLAAHEILEQYLIGRSVGPLSRSVVMGIGEPLLNYENVLAALRSVNHDLGLGARRTTISTVGFPDRLRRAARDRPPFELAISLHTPDDEQRDELIPAMRGTPIEEVLAAGDEWFDKTGREPTWEYAMLGETNTSEGHADRLVERLRNRRGSINLIPYNPTPKLPFQRPAPERVQAFRERLTAGGLVVTVRWSRGLDGSAACGQLRHRTSQGQGKPTPSAQPPTALGSEDPPP